MLRRIVKLLKNKNFIIGVFVFLQILLFFGIIILFIFSNKIGFYVLITLIALSYIISIYVMSRGTQHPAYRYTWVVAVLLFPIFGGIFYIYYNFNNFSKRTRLRYADIHAKNKESIEPYNNESESLIVKYLTNHGWSNYRNTNVDFYKTGEESIQQLISDLKKAEKFIFIEFFIIKFGNVWDTILEILAEKVKEGVEVRLIYDDFGSFELPFKYYRTLEKKYGIKAINFNPVIPIVNFQMNFRNHRKIVIIDGKIGLTGGYNIADEYVNLINPYGYWLDAGIRLEGEAVYSMTLTFLSDWEFRTKEVQNFESYLPKSDIKSDYEVIPYTDSPLIDETLTLDTLLRMIGQAKKVIYLSTPYLIIDSELTNALSLVAKSGVEVNIIIPSIPDKKLIYMVSESYIPELIANDVKIYKYNPGFVHSKIFMVDNKIASVGTTNLDYRSLYLHFENNVVFDNPKAINDIEQFFKYAIANSTEVTQKSLKKRSFIYRALQNILKGFSPLL